MRTNSPSKIFISYSHKGNGLLWKERLFQALAVFEKHSLLDPWHDDQTKLGADWHASINAAMRDARFAILLLTDEFLKSEFVLKHELRELERRHREEGLIIAPIYCEKCDWATNTWLASLQIKPRQDATPVPLASFPETDRLLRQLATEIAGQIGSIALNSIVLSPEANMGEARTYLDKFPLTQSPNLREEKLMGREQELALLNLAFAQPHTAIVSLVAWGGVGKTMLVQHWLRRLEREGWFGTRRVYAWSFYSQGTKEDRQASEDTFLAHALEWFGVQCEPTLSPWDKGRLLADATARERTLLILDGIEPLQYPPGPMGGQLRAPGVQNLLKQLARKANSEVSKCFCLVTTREPLTDLADFQRREGSPWGSGLRVDLGNLTDEAGAALLHHVGANRAGAAAINPDDKELLDSSHEVGGHALTLNLLGRFLARAHGGDIRRRDLVKFEEADRKEQGGTTFKMLTAFEEWFNNEGDIEARALTVLRLLGLFDRPADAGCMAALRKPPLIAGLTESLFTQKRDPGTGNTTEHPLSAKAWNDAVHFLSDFRLVVFHTGSGETNVLLDCHPLIREYFARQTRANVTPWEDANLRLYEHLESTAELQPGTIEALQPLYQAISHGCRAGNYNGAKYIFSFRIHRLNISYSTHQLGAFGDDLAALESFYTTPWNTLSDRIREFDQAWLLNETSLCLRSMGRLREAMEPLRRSFRMNCEASRLGNAAVVAGNLGEILLLLGDVEAAVAEEERSVELARQANDISFFAYLTALADCLHQFGHFPEAMAAFEQCSQAYSARGFPQLFAQGNFRHCELLLQKAERNAWERWLSLSIKTSSNCEEYTLLKSLCLDAKNRANRSIKLARDLHLSLLGPSLDELLIGRIGVYESLLFGTAPCMTTARLQAEKATAMLRQTGQLDQVPRALLTLAWVHCLGSDIKNNNNAYGILEEAMEVAQRGAMQLHVADIHLYRARLFFREKEYPWREGNNVKGEFVTNRTAADDLAAAEKLINECGYHRRDEELADAKRAILGT